MDWNLVWALAAVLGLAAGLWFLFWPTEPDEGWRLEEPEDYEIQLTNWRRRA